MLKKIYLIIIILSNISSKTKPTLEYDTETNFDKDNIEFNIETNTSSRFIVYLTQENKNLKLLLYSSSSYNNWDYMESYNFVSPGGGAVYYISKDKTNSMNITSNDNSPITKGTIWIHPFYKEINIDLSEKYEKLFTVMTDDLNEEEEEKESLIFSVSNLTTDKTFLFKYHSSYQFGKYTISLSNPFTICPEGVTKESRKCDNNLSNYDFKMGHNYTIYIDFEEKLIEGKNKYFLPGFSFYDKKEEKQENNFFILTVSFIEILILLFLF